MDAWQQFTHKTTVVRWSNKEASDIKSRGKDKTFASDNDPDNMIWVVRGRWNNSRYGTGCSQDNTSRDGSGAVHSSSTCCCRWIGGSGRGCELPTHDEAVRSIVASNWGTDVESRITDSHCDPDQRWCCGGMLPPLTPIVLS